MDSGAHKLLESAVQRTLHAHAFSRSSSQASAVLTDLLSRYLALLASTCHKYANHAGRTGLTVRDAIGAFEDLGLSMEELSEYCATEGKELNRYALYSARRVEDLHEFRSQLADGLRQDRDDAIPLVYQRVPSPLLEEADSEEEDDEDAEGIEDDTQDNILLDGTDMDIDGFPHKPDALTRKRPPSRPTTPPLPLSPVSNPSSPLRKRLRNSNWEPPEHIPDHLPPFPTPSDEPPSTQPDPVLAPMAPPPTQLPEVKIEKPAVQLPQPLTTTAAASDYLVQVPYSQSSLSSTPEWHLPSGPPPSPPSQARQNRPPIPQIEPSLLAAYHHILTHPPPAELPPLNPSRHKVAMALLQQSLTNSRWTPADSLFGSVGPCPPRVATIGPSYPIAIGDIPREGPEKETKLPPTISRPVSGPERIAHLVGQQTSIIPDLARHVLPPTILARTSRLSHPPVLHRGNKPLTYGPGIPAPWNANAITAGPDGAAAATPQSTKPKEPVPPSANGKETPVKPVLPDAKLFATWDYESKDFRVPLVPAAVRGRARIGSVHSSGSNLISLPVVGSSRKGTK